MQVGSALAYRGIPLQTAYCGAKHAIQGFHEALRCELLHERSGVHVTMVQMPAVNTPQFSWVLSRLPQQAQPVPPIYQPEVAARAVLYAADHPRRREYWVGGSTAGHPGRQRGRARAAGPLPGPDRLHLPADRAAPGPGPARPTCGSRPTGRTSATSARTGASTSGRRAQPQLWASQHHGLLGSIARGGRGRGQRGRRVEQPVMAGPTTEGLALTSPSPPRPHGVAGAPAPAGTGAARRRARPVSGPPEPHVLREYALLADGERGALVGPRGDIVWMCAPRWDSDAVFTSLIGGGRQCTRSPRSSPYVWGGHYEDGTLIWRSRWVTDARHHRMPGSAGLPRRPAPRGAAAPDHRRATATRASQVMLEPAAGFGRRTC